VALSGTDFFGNLGVMQGQKGWRCWLGALQAAELNFSRKI
jgi:hypothetical protein